METFISDLSNKEFPNAERISGKTVRNSIISLIQQEHPKFNADSFLSISELNEYREKYISNCLLKEVGEFTELEKTVMKSLKEGTNITAKLDSDDSKFTFGQRIADKVADFGGSWTFIILFITFMLIWISFNVYWLMNKGFDPYPFILLNLLLSCLAALQAPVIMMSQNRQEDKDRARAKNDYMINLKSELEIRMLHEKLDHLINKQMQEFMEVQRVQSDMVQDVLKMIKNKN